jgi:hypothetical protein
LAPAASDSVTAAQPAQAQVWPRRAGAAHSTGTRITLQAPDGTVCPAVYAPAGCYAADQVVSLAADAARRAAAASKGGAFGAGASQQAAGHASSSLLTDVLGSKGGSCAGPGPGCYEADRGLAGRAAAAAQRPSPVGLTPALCGREVPAGCSSLMTYLLHCTCASCRALPPGVSASHRSLAQAMSGLLEAVTCHGWGPGRTCAW